MANKIPSYYGKGGRLKKPAHPLLVNSAYKHDCSDADILIDGLYYADLAHAIALTEGGVIPKKENKKLVKALLKAKSKEIPIRPELGDVYNSKDAYMKEKIGDTAGWIHAARPRREAVNIGYLYAVRERLLDLITATAKLADSLATQSAKNMDTVMPDFTYLQHAHPTTLGHYLLTFAYPLLRDIDRLRETYEKVDASPAGSGSVNGNRLSVSRKRLQELLGFSSIATHTRDAMWQADVPIETMSNISILMLDVNRLAEELIIFSTDEFNTIDLPDDICRASVIMPQKKNPYALAYIRGLAGNFLGKTASLAATIKSYSGNPDNRTFIYGEVPRALERATEAVELMAEVVRGIKPNKKLMAERARHGFCQTTDIAEVVMTEGGVDYRTAHQIMGSVVSTMVKNGQDMGDVTVDVINHAAKEIIGKNIKITEDSINKAKDPLDIVRNRRSVGGANNARVKSMVGEIEKVAKRAKVWQKGEVQRIEKAKKDLVRESKKK